jgi:hypothetical protein
MLVFIPRCDCRLEAGVARRLNPEWHSQLQTQGRLDSNVATAGNASL